MLVVALNWSESFQPLDVTRDGVNKVKVVQALYQRFDFVCQDQLLYKVSSTKDQYVLMGYTGKVPPEERNRSHKIKEVERVISCANKILQSFN